ncbi:MAG: hypothetical protein ALECFALPRED_003083 [Alectoria fallacina]|uniref:Uncharacterized protein n=1 Tax=Alectoria fallacina TaxID=1903189 RepID=A0A8H3IEL1_9LECA|nr:MAG: hypothetical protein ALECFALPRED_003083 [Alectoria fallacina]
MPQREQSAKHSLQQRQLQGDGKHTCSQCQSAGRVCIRGYNVRFRNLVCPSSTVSPAEYTKYDFFFDVEQEWNIPKVKAEFVDENEAVVSAYGAEESHTSSSLVNVAPSSGDQHSMGNRLLPDQRVAIHTSPNYEDYNNIDQTDTAKFKEPLKSAVLPESSLDEPDEMQQMPSTHLERKRRERSPELKFTTFQKSANFDTFRPLPRSHFSSDAMSVWPLRSIEESRLLMHFVQNLGPWVRFDVGDSRRHFTKIAPSMGALSPLLMNAILAISALHLSRVSDLDSYEAVRYHDRCLGLMVPMLNDPDRVKDDNLLMTTVILHLYEDIDIGGDSVRHIMATSAFLPACGGRLSSPLRRAVFWLHLRAEIYAACSHQRIVQADLENCTFESLDTSLDNDFWLHKALWICAQTLQWAYGGDPTPAKWRELCQLIEEWSDKRPSSFDPLFFKPRNPSHNLWFPEATYATDEHAKVKVVAAHFLYLAKLLLTAHDPNIPRIGPQMKSALAEMNETALSYVRMLCGSALSNSFVPARFTASLAIIMCGSWFTHRPEQEVLIEFMQGTEQCSGWPRTQAQKTLIEDWGWPEAI